MPQLQSISPCLGFDGEAEAAVQFYTAVFPDSRVLDTVRWPEGGPVPAGHVLTLRFLLAGQEFIALNGGPQFRFSEAVSLCIRCDTQAEVEHYWQRLAEGGSHGPCGWLKDRWGLSWQVVPAVLPDLLSHPDPGVATRTLQKMMTMGRLDIDALAQAAHPKGA